MHPDDRERTLEGVRLEFEEDRSDGIEFRLRTKHHGYRWFLARGAIARDESGKPVRMAGSSTGSTSWRTEREARAVPALRS